MTDVHVHRKPGSAALEAMERAARALGSDAVVHASVYGAAAFEAERERIFARTWNFCCHESEVSTPGDFVTCSMAGSPLVVTRDRQRTLHAFYNTCLHRGCRVVSSECGNAQTLQCPYHHWTYGLDGSLRSLPGEEAYAGRSFAKDDFGLVPVRVDVVGGLVFCCLDDATESLRDFLGERAVALIEGVLGRAQFEVFHQRRLEMPTNWKMWPENARDGYHVPFVHQKSLSPISPPREYHLLGNGHAQQELGVAQAYLSDEVWTQLMSDALPGLQPGDSWNMVLFPDTLLFLRGNVFFIDSQQQIGPLATVQCGRVLGLVGDTEEQRRHRRLAWDIWFEQPLQHEDVSVMTEQQAGVTTLGPQYSLIARGADTSHGLRGDDNRLRTFWAAWRQWMGTAENMWVEEDGL